MTLNVTISMCAHRLIGRGGPDVVLGELRTGKRNRLGVGEDELRRLGNELVADRPTRDGVDLVWIDDLTCTQFHLSSILASAREQGANAAAKADESSP